MNKSWSAFVVVLAICVGLRSQPAPAPAPPQFTADNRLVLPKDYREWIFLSSGLGMTYGTPAAPGEQNFDDVFVTPTTYREFVQTGHWPDHTMFMLEQRKSSSSGTVNNGSVGHYQSELIGLAAAVKDRARFPDGEWGYFGFGTKAESTPVLPKTAACYACHSKNTAVENTFVQFYPTLLPIARAKGTLKAGFKE
ncbi:MAG: cytochrome P460 family protein [Bryobacterales bacterium]|nr:cytochrome P460 family protein [Bryobacterales bacterium]MBV9397929.1 cytochrome P460 family protein [Bryobacterales bacterium]